MAQEAKMISQADVVESLAAEGLVSVSEGAGQPQKNMELSKFADALGKAVPQQQDAEQVAITGLYAQTSEGKMVELTKESVASVMAGLMGNPLKKESVVTPSNVDAALKPGYYTMVLEPITVGGVSGNYYGVMNVYESDTYIVQVGYATTGVVIRNYRKSSKIWSAWSRLDNFGANTKEELASIVAGLMNTNKLFPFMNQSTISDETLIDSTTKSGLYVIQGLASTTYCPIQYGMMQVFNMGSIKTQVCYQHKGAACYERTDWANEGWSTWRRTDNFGYNTLPELAAALKPLMQ